MGRCRRRNGHTGTYSEINVALFHLSRGAKVKLFTTSRLQGKLQEEHEEQTRGEAERNKRTLQFHSKERYDVHGCADRKENYCTLGGRRDFFVPTGDGQPSESRKNIWCRSRGNDCAQTAAVASRLCDLPFPHASSSEGGGEEGAKQCDEADASRHPCSGEVLGRPHHIYNVRKYCRKCMKN